MNTTCIRLANPQEGARVFAIIVIGVFLTLAPGTLWGQTGSALPEQIDLETAVALALQSNLGIESEMLAVRQKKLIADTWWNRFYPQASASVTMGRLNEQPSPSPLAIFLQQQPGGPPPEDPPRWFMSGQLNFSLDLTLQTFPGISLSRLDYEMGLLTLAEARNQVERDVGKQFYNLLLTAEQIALMEQRIASAERRYEQAQVNFANGLIDEFSLLSAQVAVENQRPALKAMQGGYQQQLLVFRNTLGLPLRTQVVPVGTIDPPAVDREVLETAMFQNRLDLQQLRLLEQIRKEQIRVNDFSPGGRYPFLRFGLTVDPRFEGDPLQDSWFDRERWNQQSGAFTITLVQPLTAWFPYSQQRNEITGLEREIERNRLNMEQAIRGAEIRVEGLLLGIENSQRTMVALTENIRLARRAFELAEVGYNNGLRELLEVQNAEIELRDAELQLLQEQKNVMDNLLDLIFELNVSMDEVTAGRQGN